MFWRSSERAFETELFKRTQAALELLRERIGTERLYAFALYTDDLVEPSYVTLSANTEEGFQRYLDESALDDADATLALGRAIRWNACDWAYHDFSSSLHALSVPPRSLAAFYRVLRRLDEEQAFGDEKARDRVLVNVLCGDMSDRDFERGLRKLNPAVVVESYVREWTPRPFIQSVNKQDAATRLSFWLTTYENLSLNNGGSRDALAAGVTIADAEEQLRAFGRRAVPGLVAILRSHGLAKTFNEEGSKAFARSGAFTDESNLASRTVFLLGELGHVRPDEIRAMQELIAALVERDRAEALASPLAENIARVLHQLAPRRFPPSELDPKTNHLRNAGPFLLSSA